MMFSIIGREEKSMCYPAKNTSENRYKKESEKVGERHHHTIEKSCDHQYYDDTTTVSRTSYIFHELTSSECYFSEILEECLLSMFLAFREPRFSEERFIKNIFYCLEPGSDHLSIILFEYVSTCDIVIICDSDMSISRIEIGSSEKSQKEYREDKCIKNPKHSKHCKYTPNNSATESDETCYQGHDRKRYARPPDHLEIVSVECHPEFIWREPFVEIKSTFIDSFLYMFWSFVCFGGGECAYAHKKSNIKKLKI